MFRLRPVLILTGIILLLVGGCSQNEESSPTAPKMNFTSAFNKDIGPSEIVLCLDVSDSVSNEELQAVVDALNTTLADPSLIPQDGQVALGAVVYGDTIAEAISGLVPVTADNLTNIITPALNGLLTDRLVPTTGVDLAAGLRGCLDVLSGQSVKDQHILMVASGEADDGIALAEACTEVKAAGVMNSVILFRETSSHHFDLSMCAESSGGYFESTMDDLEGALGRALKYMLVVEMGVEPRDAELARGEEHTVTAVVFRGEDSENYPVSGHDVTFTVIEGPNMGDPSTVATDTMGMAAISYTGDGGTGIDRIAVTTLHPGTEEALTDTVMVTWLNTPPTCDAGGPYLATFATDTVVVTLDGTGSSDADGDTLTFHWSADFEGATFDDPTAAMPVLTITGEVLCADSLMVDLMVKDASDSSMCQAVIVLDDMRAPLVEIREEPIALWPVNHKYHTITPDMVFTKAEDACGNPIDLSAVEVVSVSSDEPEDHQGDGRTLDDIVIDCPNQVRLRAERMGGGEGRVYTIHYLVTGENGATAEAEFKVVVPHDQSGGMVVEREGMGYTVEADCPDES